MKKLITLLLSVVLALSLCACGLTDGGESTTKAVDNSTTKAADSSNAAETGSGSDEETKGGEVSGPTTIRVNIDMDPGNLGPYSTYNTGKKQTLPNIYQTLVSNTTDREAELVLAKSIEHPDDTTWNVEIWDGITDTAGNVITAEDVKWSYENEESAAQWRYTKKLKGIDVVDDTHLVFHIDDNTVSGINTYFNVNIVSQKAFEESGDSMAAKPVGTGPYKMVEYVEGASMIVEKRDDYWKPEADRTVYEQQNVDRIEYYVNAESAQVAIGLETDMTDMASNLSYAQASQFEGNSDYKVFEDMSNTTYTIFFNANEASKCSDVRVRQAICYAIDAQGVIDGALDGKGEKLFAYGSPIFPDILSSWDDGEYYEYNPEKAKELLKEAGYNNDLEIHFLLRSRELDQNVAQIVQGYLEAVGVSCVLDVYEQTLAQTYQRDFTVWDIYLRQAGQDVAMITGWNKDFNQSGFDNGLPYNGIQDPKLQEMLEKTANANGWSEDGMTELHYYMKDQVYVYSMFTQYVYTVARADKVDNILLDASYWLQPGGCTYTWN